MQQHVQKIHIYGKNAMKEALLTQPKHIEEVYMAPQFDDADLRKRIQKAGIPTTTKIPPGVDPLVVHQGIVGLILSRNMMQEYKIFIDSLPVTPNTALVLLGELQDPQNVGAIVRSAVAFGFSGVLIPEHDQAPITGAVVKVSAGMVFHIPLVTIGNINTTIRDLKDRGFRVYGLDGDAKHTVTKEVFGAPSVFIIGNEAEGIREKTRELCDKMIAIPISVKCESLNAATSASVAFYAWSREHQGMLHAPIIKKV